MIQFFRKIRQKLVSDGKAGTYFKYAIGEIFLVVIGILIALQINNWNQKRILDNDLAQIQQRIILDIDNDIKDLRTALIYWKEKEHLFNKVIQDSITPDLFDQGLSRLIGQTFQRNLNKAGVEQLKRMNVTDVLSLRIIDIYDQMENIYIVPYENKISESAHNFRVKIRDNYDWFSEWTSKTIMSNNSSEELQAYFLTNPEYRNWVSNSHLLIYGNYLRFLEFYIPILENLRTQLREIHDPNFSRISNEQLEKYVGAYKITKIEGADFGLQIDDIYIIDGRPNFLRITQASNPGNYFDFYYSGRNTFYYSVDGTSIPLTFESDDSGILNGYKLSMNSDQEEGIIYTTKQHPEN